MTNCPVVYFVVQAEDGIRDGHVTGVQTCALPILFICFQCWSLNISLDIHSLYFEAAPDDLCKSRQWLTVAKDRKSTRLNSSHVAISYAVFCLKKKINSASQYLSVYHSDICE